MISQRTRPLLLAASVLAFCQCTPNPPDPSPRASVPQGFHRIDESVAAYERGDWDATYYHLASLWLECGSTELAREALVVAIATELDPANPWSGFERAADFAAAFRGLAVDSSWHRSMAEALRAWSETFGSSSGSDTQQKSGESDLTRQPSSMRAASPAPVLRSAVLRITAPRNGDGCTAPPDYVGPARRMTARSPAPAVVAHIVELESTRLRLVRDLADLRARVRDLGELTMRMRDQERELERLRTLLKP